MNFPAGRITYRFVMPGGELDVVVLFQSYQALDGYSVVTPRPDLVSDSAGYYSVDVTIDVPGNYTFEFTPMLDGQPHPYYGPWTEQVTVEGTVEVDIDPMEIVDHLMTHMAVTEGLSPGPGLGSFRYEDTLLGQGNSPVSMAIVRAFPHDPDLHTTDFYDLKGSCTTDQLGRYHLNLDPGTYARRVWKNGTVLLDDLITVI